MNMWKGLTHLGLSNIIWYESHQHIVTRLFAKILPEIVKILPDFIVSASVRVVKCAAQKSRETTPYRWLSGFKFGAAL